VNQSAEQTAADEQPKPAPQPSLSVVIPLYKEEESVPHLVEAVHEGLRSYRGPWELICVDDGSADATRDRMREAIERYGAHVRLIELQRNFGQTAAMQAGIDAANGDVIATMDGDLQNDPDDIPRMVDEMLERDLDLLQGWRKNRHDAAVKRKLPSKIANRLIGKVTGLRLHDYGCSLKIYRASILKQVRLFGEMHRFIPVWVAGVTSPHRIGETAVTHHPRKHGESKYGISRTYRVIVDLLSVFFFLRFGARPGHFFGLIGLSLGTVGGLILSWLMVVKFGLGQDIGGRPLLIVGVVCVLSALQFLTTGVLAEMLTRIFFQGTEGRHFVVRDEQRSGESSHWFQTAPRD
jgi:glycosyltransferase involved in cell wall biosynthesis